METKGPISPEQASAALAAARQSRAQVAWSGYPAWYWFATAASLAAMPAMMMLPTWWVPAAAVPIAAALILIPYAAAHARGIRENCTRTALTLRDKAVLYGPAAVFLLAGAAASKVVSWALPAAAVLTFLAVVTTGLTLGTRATRS